MRSDILVDMCLYDLSVFVLDGAIFFFNVFGFDCYRDLLPYV